MATFMAARCWSSILIQRLCAYKSFLHGAPGSSVDRPTWAGYRASRAAADAQWTIAMRRSQDGGAMNGLVSGMRVAATVLVGFAVLGAVGEAAADDLKIADGLTVTIEYTLMLPDKTVIDSNVGKRPFTYTQGQPEILQSLQKALVGMKAGQKKQVDLLAEQAFGLHDKTATMTIERAKAPPDVAVGSVMRAPDSRPGVVLEVSEKAVVLNMNHPLAGKNILFDVKIIKVDRAQPGSSKTP
ncbi:MAG: peptidylprolyl isomerase [Nitrospirae bacterium]|nr:MAG: peptidylprolyl isomerase [Nitrospirota bacterium]